MTKAAESIQRSVFIESLHNLPIKNQVFCIKPYKKSLTEGKILAVKLKGMKYWLCTPVSVFLSWSFQSFAGPSHKEEKQQQQKKLNYEDNIYYSRSTSVFQAGETDGYFKTFQMSHDFDHRSAVWKVKRHTCWFPKIYLRIRIWHAK